MPHFLEIQRVFARQFVNQLTLIAFVFVRAEYPGIPRFQDLRRSNDDDGSPQNRNLFFLFFSLTHHNFYDKRHCDDHQ